MNNRNDKSKFQDVRIYEQDLDNGAKLAIFVGGLDSSDPINYMNEVVADYVKRDEYNEFIEEHLDNPWVRVVIKGINNIRFKRYHE